MRTVELPGGERVPILGLGTWRMGERKRARDDEVAALRLGLDLGFRLIDTAELYGSGDAETIVAEAIAGRRDEVYLVSKVMPQNASRRGAVAACEHSLKRLKTDRLDLFLLHWQGAVPLAETFEAFLALEKAGKIRAFGVSNFDTAEMAGAAAADGTRIATNQVLYNLARRGAEWDLLPWLHKHRIPLMAYSPLDQGGILRNRALAELARTRGVSPAALALAWVIRRNDVFAVVKATTPEHVRDNFAAARIRLSDEDCAALDRAFPPPARRTPLKIL